MGDSELYKLFWNDRNDERSYVQLLQIQSGMIVNGMTSIRLVEVEQVLEATSEDQKNLKDEMTYTTRIIFQLRRPKNGPSPPTPPEGTTSIPARTTSHKYVGSCRVVLGDAAGIYLITFVIGNLYYVQESRRRWQLFYSRLHTEAPCIKEPHRQHPATYLPQSRKPGARKNLPEQALIRTRIMHIAICL